MALRLDCVLAGVLTFWMLQTAVIGETGTRPGTVGHLLQKIREMAETRACNGTAAPATRSIGTGRNLTCTGKDTPLSSSTNLQVDSEKTHNRGKATTMNPFKSNDNSLDDLHKPSPISRKAALFLLIMSATAPIVGLGFILSPCFDSKPPHHNGTRPRRLSSADDPDSTSAHIHIELAMAGHGDNNKEDRKVETQQSVEKVSCSSEDTCLTPIADNGATMGDTNVTL
uniref:Uncharacterized protein n=1 Tax=Branchiostoma floridae TaxID=7739 RepID=C3YSI7_BRAFL|eukprot:XP_002600676.1 hypothetical protein BRAFLDRAFT_67739 [Branchiostoma floridae]